MNRKSMLSIIALALLALPALLLLRPADATPPGGVGRPSAWLAEGTIDGVPGLVFNFVTCFSGNASGGSFTTTDTTDFGFGGVTPGFDSPANGTWARTAEFTTEGRGIYFSYDLAGTHTATVVSSWVSVGDRDDPLNSASGTWFNEVFLPGQDPLVDEPVQVASGTFTSRRIAAP